MNSTMTRKYETKEIWCEREGAHIYGTAYIPDGSGPHPLIIFSHELGKNHTAAGPYAGRLASAGYAVYALDYCGGSVPCNLRGETVRAIRSSGSTTDMSVLTEINDLEAVLLAAESWPFADRDRTILMGASQGAVVSVLTAGRNPGRTAGLILLYPPLDLPDRMHRAFHTPDQIPERFDLFDGWVSLGRRYAADIWDLDVYAELSGYDREILILHGDADTTVDISVSLKAVEMGIPCSFCRIGGGVHGFKGEKAEEAAERILAFLAALNVQK